MSHKVHPKIFRLRNVSDWQSRWLTKKKFSQNLEQDFEIRKFLKGKIGKIGLEKIEIERFADKVNVIIYSARPGLIIGRGGSGIEEIKKQLETILPAKKKGEIKIDIKEVRNPWASAFLSSQWITEGIEKRLPFRRVLKQSLDKIMSSKGVEGARVEVAGRLNGAEIARTEWVKKGKLPRQTLRADIDYAQNSAYCTYGVIGVKVWIYKGELFE